MLYQAPRLRKRAVIASSGESRGWTQVQRRRWPQGRAKVHAQCEDGSTTAAPPSSASGVEAPCSYAATTWGNVPLSGLVAARTRAAPVTICRGTCERGQDTDVMYKGRAPVWHLVIASEAWLV